MAALRKLIDAILLFFFALLVVCVPLIDAQTCLSSFIYLQFLVSQKQWYSLKFGDYLFERKPGFFVGLILQELLFLWPLILANIYAILAGKLWFRTTCLMLGASLVTSMSAILGEMIGSGKASNKLLMMYVPFMGLGILAIVRGLVSDCTIRVGADSSARKKRA